MTQAQLHNYIRARFSSQVAAPQSLATVYDNGPSTPPTDGGMWCRFTIRRGETQRITTGVKQYRMRGIAFAQLFCGVGLGDGDLLELAEAIADAFQSVTADGVRYATPTVRPIGVTDEGNEYQVNVECPFSADTQES